MSDDAAQPGRTGRGGKGRHPAEAPPAEGQPEDSPQLAEAEAEAGVTEGIYFAKAPGRDVWHGYDEDHEPIGTVFHDGQRWKVRVARETISASFGSATSGKAFLSGWALRGIHDAAARMVPVIQPGHVQRSAEPISGGTDASHDASTQG